MATSGRVQQLLRHILRHGAAPPPPDGAGSPGGGATPGASPANGEPRRRVSLSTPPGAHEGGASATSAASAMQQKIRIGVCAMDKKAQSKPMREILGRLLRYGEFEMVAFGDEVRARGGQIADASLISHRDGGGGRRGRGARGGAGCTEGGAAD